MILLIDNTDSFTYNLYQMIQAQTPAPVQVVRNDALTIGEVIRLRPERIIFSPGPGHPAIAKDFGVCGDILQQYEQLNCPVLGVCLGHQGIALAFGGELCQLDTVVHGKVSSVQILPMACATENPDPGCSSASLYPSVLNGLPSPFEAMRYHSWVVSENNFPDELMITAFTEQADGSRHIMALQHKAHPIYGVQFHPESIGTPHGAKLLKNFLEISAFRANV